MTINKSNAMSTKEEKQSNSGNNSTIKEDSTQSFESKFSEKPQNSFDSSDSGQQYEIIDKTPFVAVKQGDAWRIAIGNMVASPYKFESKEAVEDYVKEKPWELIWTAVIWVINNRERFNFKTEEK